MTDTFLKVTMSLLLKVQVVFLSVCIWRTCVLGFNLEDRKTTVKRGEKGSYFGYSVALHKTENDGDIENSWLLVGAPIGQNLQPNTTKSGALFKCPITDFQEERDCIQVETDGRRSSDFEYDELAEKHPFSLKAPGNDEIKTNQWLGVNVRSQGPGGKVMVCAHRYIWSKNTSLNQFGLGLCYVLNNDLEWEDQIEPCRGRSVEREHQEFGYCQVGTGLALLSDGTALLGSPGPFTWRGTVFVLEIAGDFLHKDKTVYQGPLNETPKPINKYSYLGMSVTAGKFFHDRKMSYAGGAPRSQDHGQVYIFQNRLGETQMDISLIIDGEQFASNFGYEVLAGDFNNDGFDDLLVAAPFYFDSANNGGGVYIYYNLRNCTTGNCSSDAILRGVLESRFGFAMANIGDINLDGYNDLAVGAPYEGNGAIYIYLGSKDGIISKPSQKIFYKSSNVKTLGYSLSGGLDIDNNGYPDLLAGAYDSDAVVLFRTRPIVDIETEVTGKELKNIDAASHGCLKNASSSFKCFSFRACFNITSEMKTLNNVTIISDISEDVGKANSRTWFELDISQNGTKFINYRKRYFQLHRHQPNYCQEETVYLQHNIRDILTPIQFLVSYELGNKEAHSPILNQSSIKNFEATFQKNCGSDDICQSNMIMNAGLRLNKTAETQDYIFYPGEVAEINVDINVTNKGDPAYEAKAFIMFPSTVKFIAANKTLAKCNSKNDTIVVCELGNPLNSNKSLSLHLRFEPIGIENRPSSTDDVLQFTIFVNSTSEELSTQTKAELKALITRSAKIKVSRGSFTKTLMYSGDIKGESAMKNLNDIGNTVLHEYQIEQLGPISTADLEVVVLWPWQIRNSQPQGKWLLYLEEIKIIEGRESDYCYVEPFNAINFLNLTKTIQKGHPLLHNISRSSDKRFAKHPENPYNMTSESLVLDAFNKWNDQEQTESYLSRLIRRRRSTEDVVSPESIPGSDGKTRKVVTMDCTRDTAKCVVINCKFPKFSTKMKSTSLQIISRLWNSTLIEDYSQVDWVRIVSHANVSVTDANIQTHKESQLTANIETNAYPDLSIQLDSGVPLWIIILAVVIGLILLILLIFILWRVGFFKRNRIKDPTLSGNLTKQSEQETLLTNK